MTLDNLAALELAVKLLPHARLAFKLDRGDRGKNIDAFIQSAAASAVTTLSLGGMTWSEAMARKLASSQALTALTTLKTHNMGAFKQPGVLTAFCEALCWPNLTHLDLHHARDLQPISFACLATTPALATLRSLDVSSNELRDEDAVAIVESPYLSSLEQLNLARNAYYNNSWWNMFGAIRASPHLTSLTSLNLSENNVYGKVNELVQAEHLPRLTRLYLDRAGINDEGALALIHSDKLTSLSYISLRLTKLSEETIQALKASRVKVVLD